MMQKDRKNQKWKARVLGGVLLFVGVGGLAGGVPLLLDPSGASLGMELTVLAGSPFSSYLIPGLVVLVINGLLPCVLGFAAIRQHRRSGDMGIGYGIWLIGYMVAQVWWIGLIAGIQYLFLAMGFITLSLGVLVRKQMRT